MNGVEIHGSKIEAWVEVGDIKTFGVINEGSRSQKILTVQHEEDAHELSKRFAEAAKRLEKGR